MKLPIFKCRASAVGDIMTNGRTSNELGKTCTSYLEKWAKLHIYQRQKQIRSKYLTKGVEKESDSIKFCSEYFGWGEVKKNEQWFEDDFFTGTPDVITPLTVEDIKNSFSSDTFPLFAEEMTDKGYEYQLRAYMQLTGKSSAGLCYTLMNAPDHLIEREAWFKQKELGLEEMPVELFEQVKAEMTYEHLDPLIRVKRFSVEADPFVLAAMQTRVIECRKYIVKYIEPKINHL